jgi:hypothetical protein
MEDKIDLDAILEEIPESTWEDTVSTVSGTHTFMAISVEGAKQLAKAAIHQALVLAGKQVDLYSTLEQNKQYILDVEKLIV